MADSGVDVAFRSAASSEGVDRRLPPLRCGGTVGMEVFGLRGVFVVVVVVVLVVVIVIVTSGMGEYQVPIPSGFSAADDGGTASAVMDGTASWGTEILDRRRCRGDPEVERVVAVPVACGSAPCDREEGVILFGERYVGQCPTAVDLVFEHLRDLHDVLAKQLNSKGARPGVGGWVQLRRGPFPDVPVPVPRAHTETEGAGLVV